MRQPPVESGPVPGVTTPGQLGPTSRVRPPLMVRFTRTMSRIGMPSVMATTRSRSAFAHSRMASAAKAGGTKMADTVAPVAAAASATELKMGTLYCLYSKNWPPLPGVTPATTCVP